MTIQEVINRVRAIKSPCPPEADLVKVISEAEGEIYRRIIAPRGAETEFVGYTAADLTTTLQAPTPFDNLYVFACLRHIDLTENQITNYNNDEREYKELLGEFAAWYLRKHKPDGNPRMRSDWYGI